MPLDERLDAMGADTPEARKMWTDCWAFSAAWSAREDENRKRAARGEEPLPNIEDYRKTRNKNDDKKRFHAQGDRPRRDE